MYFKIKSEFYNPKLKPNIKYMEEIRSIIKMLPEIEELYDDCYNIDDSLKKYYIYYKFDIKAIRKLKLLSLSDEILKEKLSKVLTVISNENLIVQLELSENQK